MGARHMLLEMSATKRSIGHLVAQHSKDFGNKSWSFPSAAPWAIAQQDVEKPPSSTCTLYDTDTPAELVDFQLRDMTARAEVASSLAPRGKLRPYQSPLDAAAALVYLQERSRVRLEAFRHASRSTVSAAILAESSIASLV
jgi:hypothetical protein